MAFNWIHYKMLNRIVGSGDLEKNGIRTITQCISHYNRYGKSEGRPCNILNVYPDFNWTEYKNKHNLKTKEESEYHFLKNIIDQKNKPIETNKEFVTNIELEEKQLNITSYDNNCNSSMDENEIHLTDKSTIYPFVNSIYNEYILIVDLPCVGGGTLFFINSIVSHYKKNINFLIARNHNNSMHFYINDITLVKKCSIDESIKFLEENKNKIIKIFVSHPSSHSIIFLNSLFTLGKHVATTTHDTAYISNILNPLLCKYNMVITQNSMNLHLFNKYLTTEQSIVVSPLPDFIKGNINTTDNSKIVVCFIGAIHKSKGSNRVKAIVSHFRLNNRIQFVLFGSADVSINIPQHKYTSIRHLNHLLSRYKPNIIIETTIAPETYSYTLSLMMATSLPIIYFKKPHISAPIYKFETNRMSVVEDRLSKYGNAYPITSLDQLSNFIFSKKQDFFTTIDPTLYFNSFWDKYFLE
jgi:hypothetical protein